MKTEPLPPRLAGKKAVITGAARGLGEAFARMFARHGATLFLTDIDAATVETVARGLNDQYGAGTAHAAAHDVRGEDAWRTVLAQANAAMGGISVLVNNAGVGSMGGVESVAFEEWRRVMAINVDSVFLGCKHALPYLRDNQPGSIVNISSIAAIIAAAHYPAYNASKAAVLMLTKSVALDCAAQGMDVRCNSVHPAFVRTAIVEPYVQRFGEEEAIRKLSRGIPLKRLGTPEEVAYAVLYLASDESRFVTASELKVDGGISAT